MRINKLTASFGKLNNETLSFHGGLNVINAPNESGKSTWCAFIRAMLYGVDSSERSRIGYLPDKLRYAPWSGAPMEGSMELTADNCDITLTRRTSSKSAPMRDFSATYTGTGTKVEGITADNCGEMLTGVSKDVFRRSAFVEQGTVAVKGSPELEKRIGAIVSTGEEQISYTEADEQLRAWQRKRRFNRRGFLPALEDKIDYTQRKLDEMENSAQESEQLEKKLREAQLRCEELEAKVTESRKTQRRESLQRLSDGRAELKRRSEEHDEALRQLSERRQELRQSRFGDMSGEELEAKVERDIAAVKALESPVQSGGALFPILALISFILAAVCASVYISGHQVLLAIGGAVFTVLTVLFLMQHMKRRRALKDNESERMAILNRYSASGAEDIRASLRQHDALNDMISAAIEREEQTRLAFEQAGERLTLMEEAAINELDFVSGSSEAARLSRELTAQRAEVERLSAKLSESGGKMAVMGDPLVLRSDLSVMREEQRQLQLEYDALGLAIETLRQADGEIQSRFSPRLGKVAAEYMSLVTDGKYSDVLINRDFSAMARASGDTVAHESEYLSAGTIDLLYLAVRLAVCELAMPDGEPCPLIIDDALVNLDDERRAQAMELLKNIARERQVILFTCR